MCVCVCENVLVITKSVVSTPVYLEVKIQVAQDMCVCVCVCVCENVLVITKSVVSTPVHLDVKIISVCVWLCVCAC